MSPSSSSSCSRWSPSPQQVTILEELYTRGVKAPNPFQRQTIASHLSFYGHIQPKNVFYWFQNHKARSRKKLMLKEKKQHHHQHNRQKNITLDFHSSTHGTQGDGGEEARVQGEISMNKEEYWKVHDLMMMLETCPYCCNLSRPLVTLQLFPLTASK